MQSTMADKSSSEERTISPETTSQASDQPGENVAPPPPPRTRGKPNERLKLEDDLTEGASFLTNTFKQFANKPIQDCIKDGFPSSFHHVQNSQATELSINADVSMSEPGRSYLQVTDGLDPVSFPLSFHAPDDELDENGNPTLHFNAMQLRTSTKPQ
jgi:hypothetical protein